MSLPKGWIEIILEEVVDVLDAQRVPINNTERAHRIVGKDKSELFPYYGATGNTGYIDDYLFDEELVLLGEDGVPFFDPLKHKAYIISGKTWVNNHAHVLRAKKSLTMNSFLTYFLNQFDYHGYVNGATRLKLNQTNMKKIPFVLPPLNEQKRIAKKLDELLGTVESIKIRLNNAPSILKRFRQSILAAATSGKLTEEWREENGVDAWKSITLAEATTKVGSGSTPKGGKSSYKERGIPLIRSMNIHFYGIKYKDLAFIDDDQAKKLSNVIIEERDVLLNITGASIGRVTLAPSDLVGARVNQHVSIIRTKQEKLIPEYLNFYLAAPITQKWIQAENYGGTREALTKTMILDYEIPQPSIEEQKEIVSQVESLFALADSMEAKIEAAQKHVDKLTQSILAKAFRGELVEQDPNDEPAEKLLERIREEQELVKPKKRIKKKTTKKNISYCTSIENFSNFIVDEFKEKEFTIKDISLIGECTEEKLIKFVFKLLKNKHFTIKKNRYEISSFWKNNQQVLKVQKIVE